MRGGSVFWDFRSFNPPISNLNWANQYATDALARENTLVSSSDYRDVPVDWLGQAFIDEADDLKETNPNAYEHEYLGVPVGTGGNVFENVEPRYISDSEIASFERIDRGVDWGWYPDPFHYSGVHLDAARRDLYVFQEFRANKLSNQQTFDKIFKELKFAKADDIITCDSAEQKSISDWRSYGAYGARPMKKEADGIVYGIKWMQSLRHIYIDPKRCPATLKEFIEYEYERDREDEIISGYPDKDNHAIDSIRYATSPHWRRKGQ